MRAVGAILKYLSRGCAAISSPPRCGAELSRTWIPAAAAGLALGKPVQRMPGHADWRHWSAGSFTAQTAGVLGVATFPGFGVPLAATASRLPCEQRMAIGFAGPRAAPVRRGHGACAEGRRRPGHAISRGAGER